MEHSFEDGKYTVKYTEKTGALKAYRYGEYWQDLAGNNLVAAMLFEVDRLKNELEEKQSFDPSSIVLSRDNLTTFKECPLAFYQKVFDVHKAIADIMLSHDWQCGCGHWNGANLEHCAQCGRRPGDTT